MNKIANLQSIANILRIKSINITTKAASGHPTSCLSIAEIMSCVFFSAMKYELKNSVFNDELILSKGHAAPILWSAYEHAGIIKEKELQNFRQINSRLEGHPTASMPWIKAATGSLGQGLAAGIGISIANRIRGIDAKTFVIMGDGELAEGSVWEAASIASKQKVSITAIVDVNRLGQSGESLHGHKINLWKKKFDSFGWNTTIINGHSIPQILTALKIASKSKKPFVILAKTIKGKGVSFLENKEGFHGKALSEEEAQNAITEIGIQNAEKVVVKEPSKNIKKMVTNASLPKFTESVATRKAYGLTLESLGSNEQIVVLDGDTKNSTFTDLFEKKYGERFIECFIAEQTMAGISLGIQAKGLIPFPTTFGAFFSRAHDQIRMAAISKAHINFVGTHNGVSIGMDGPSQMGLEDIAMFRCIPDSVVLCPCDANSTAKITKLMLSRKGINYLRLTRPECSLVYSNNSKFTIGGCNVLKTGTKAYIITAGITVQESLEAVKNYGNKVGVIDAYSIKPLDKKTILRVTKGKKVIVIEDHYAEGGLGEAVGSLGIKYTHIAVDSLPNSGSTKDLLKKYLLDSKGIKSVISKTFK